MLERSIIAVHVIANLVWVGSIVATALVLSSSKGEPALRGALGVEIYKKLAMPAFLVSFVAGGARLGLDVHLYFVETKFMHGKLLFALLVIALHHVIGARAKRMANGQKTEAGIVGTLSTMLLLSAAAAAIFAVLKPF